MSGRHIANSLLYCSRIYIRNVLFNYKIFLFFRQGSDEESNHQAQRRLINKRRVCTKICFEKKNNNKEYILNLDSIY